MIHIIDENYKLLKYKNVKSETVLLKQYILNLILGEKSNNSYIIQRYEYIVNVEFDKWNESVNDFTLNKDYYYIFENMLTNINTILNYILRNSVEDIILHISSIYDVKPIILFGSYMGGIYKRKYK